MRSFHDEEEGRRDDRVYIHWKPLDLCFTKFNDNKPLKTLCGYNYFEQDLLDISASATTTNINVENKIVVVLKADLLVMLLDLLTRNGARHLRLNIAAGIPEHIVTDIRNKYPFFMLEFLTEIPRFTVAMLLKMTWKRLSGKIDKIEENRWVHY